VSETKRIYFDHAATSWPKSDEMLNQVNGYARKVGAAVGRGNYRSADLASQQIRMARRGIAKLIGAPSADCISLHSNGTMALNAAILGLVRPGDHVVTTAADHNSVLRPLHHLQETADVRLTVIPCNEYGEVAAQDVIASVRPDTRMVIMTHASNVTGAGQPVCAIGEAIADSPTYFVVDAAQTLGYVHTAVPSLKCDALASPGHKGLGGPLGTGFLYVSKQIAADIKPILFGGTGSQSESLDMPTGYPEKLEPGNLNVPAIAGLAFAASQACQIDFAERSKRLHQLSRSLHDGLDSVSGIEVHSRPGPLPILSLSMPSMTAADIAAILDVEFGIETRAGFHCAALIEPHLNCNSGGTLRISGGPSTTDEEIESVLSALKSIASPV
jgi:selenocysteine lyase/cysteine desulfurase